MTKILSDAGALTKKEDWEGKPTKQIKTSSIKFFLKQIRDNVFGSGHNMDRSTLFMLFFYINKKVEEHLNKSNKSKILEVGSAPGTELIYFKNKFGYEPYGVEYTEEGAKINKELFIKNNIDPNNVIHCDFFDEDFEKKYRNYFDIVYSLGFIEHFANPKKVVERHLTFLKSGGILIIGIPNFRVITFPLLRIFRKGMFHGENLEIMSINKFEELFDDGSLDKIYCGYIGTSFFSWFNFFYPLYLGYYLQYILQPILKRIEFKNRYLSPYILY